MQIPLTLPEQTTPLPTRRDIQALSPVSAVPGVEGLAETLDPRLALQWTQPVLGDQSADLARSVLESVKTPTSTPMMPSAGSTGSAAVAWSSLAQVLGPLLQRIGSSAESSVPWPGKASHRPPEPEVPASGNASLIQALQSLRTQLAQSDMFAAHHLVQHWFTPPVTAKPATEPPSSIPDSDTFARWVSALSPDSSTAEDITRMLLNGEMQWQGELLPGIAVTLDREDAWREDPQHPGQAQKGAALRAQLDLPRSGRITVTAYQWGSHIDMRIAMPSNTDTPLHAAWPLLQERLFALNLPELRVAREDAP